jgi:hypothetical protein
MSIRSNLAMVARGERPPASGLLESCRFDWGGSETIGEEAILEAMAAQPLAGLAEARLIESPTGAALIGAGDALFADVYDGRIGRLWRVGMASGLVREPAVDVPFDPDLMQLRGDINFHAGDHTGLDTAQADRVVAAAHELLALARTPPMHRARLFVTRVVADGGDLAVLAAVHRLHGGAKRGGGFGFGIAAPGVAPTAFILDPPVVTQWTPRV